MVPWAAGGTTAATLGAARAGALGGTVAEASGACTGDTTSADALVAAGAEALTAATPTSGPSLTSSDYALISEQRSKMIGGAGDFVGTPVAISRSPHVAVDTKVEG